MTLRAAPTCWLMLLMLLVGSVAAGLAGPAAAQQREDDAVTYTVRKETR